MAMSGRSVRGVSMGLLSRSQPVVGAISDWAMGFSHTFFDIVLDTALGGQGQVWKLRVSGQHHGGVCGCGTEKNNRQQMKLTRDANKKTGFLIDMIKSFPATRSS